MKARVLDDQVKVYSSMEANAISIATLDAGSEIEIGATKRKAGKLWVPVVLPNGQQAFIPAETRIQLVRQGALLQNNIALLAEPVEGALVKQHLSRNTKLEIVQVVKDEGKDWVKVRVENGMEGYISGNTRIRLIQQKTKAGGRKNILSGAMWLIAGLVIVFSNSSSNTGGSFIVFGYGAILFGAVMLISGLVQYFTAPT